MKIIAYIKRTYKNYRIRKQKKKRETIRRCS